MKQETLEEAIKRIYGDDEDGMYINKIDFKDGAKWQQERTYREEEVLKLILTSSRLPFANDEERIEWFEQFKKK